MDIYPRQYLYRRVVRAKLYIDANFSAAIDLDEIADQACFSKFHFMRLFKSAYGRTPHRYLTHVRVKHAKEMLMRGETVAAACFNVGFDSLPSFTTLFKRTTGITPAAFQSQQIERDNEILARPLKFVPNCFAEAKGWKEQQFSIREND